MPDLPSAWPSQRDYIEALQDPASAFVDPALRLATVESDVFGLPRPRSGRMASVYRVFDDDRTWAVRCFNFGSDERVDRYRAISDFLSRHPNPYTVGFEYCEDGIVVGAARYPILKMEWIEGELLHTYMFEHREAPADLDRLADAWVALVADLHALGIAHGDLQHGNVLVTETGELKLIDYDGMYVPAFARLASLENGHPNYQHPCRLSRDFGPALDNFSAWVVFLSIVAVARDASVWDGLHFGDDRLAFGRADYETPSESFAFATLGAARDPDVRTMTLFLISLLSHEPQRLPPLEERAKLPFAHEALRPGPYVEPFRIAHVEPMVPKKRNSSRVEPVSARTRLALVVGGGGFAGTLAGYVALHQFGFSTQQNLAILGLGIAFAGILAAASRGPKPP